jgi:hypothetical protein
MKLDDHVLDSATRYIDRLNHDVAFYENRWRAFGGSGRSCLIIVPGPDHAGAGLPQNIDTLALLYDQLLWVKPSSTILIPEDQDKMGQIVARKIGMLCEAGVIRTLGASYGPPLESWAELQSIRADLHSDYASYAGQIALERINKASNQQEEDELTFCRVFNFIFNLELQRNSQLSNAFRETYLLTHDSASLGRECAWGLWDLRRIAQTRYILSGIGDVRCVSGVGELESYADAILGRLLRVASIRSQVETKSLTAGVGEQEIITPVVSNVPLRYPLEMDAEELRDLRDSSESAHLRAVLARTLKANSSQDEVKEAFEQLRGATEGKRKGGIGADVTITSLMTTIGYYVGDLPGALIGNVGSIPMILLARSILERLRDARLRWFHDMSERTRHDIATEPADRADGQGRRSSV